MKMTAMDFNLINFEPNLEGTENNILNFSAQTEAERANAINEELQQQLNEWIRSHPGAH